MLAANQLLSLFQSVQSVGDDALASGEEHGQQLPARHEERPSYRLQQQAQAERPSCRLQQQAQADRPSCRLQQQAEAEPPSETVPSSPEAVPSSPEAVPSSPEAVPQSDDLEKSSAADTPEVPVRFQKELIFQQPTIFFELEVKKSYQRVLGRSLKWRIAEIDDQEEDMLRHVQLHQTYKLLRKYQVGKIWHYAFWKNATAISFEFITYIRCYFLVLFAAA